MRNKIHEKTDKEKTKNHLYTALFIIALVIVVIVVGFFLVILILNILLHMVFGENPILWGI